MDMFEKAAKAAKEVGDNVIHSAKNLGESLYNLTKEQSELASLNIQKSVVEKRLESSYAEIGKRYVEYVEKCDGGDAFDVSDVLENIEPELEKLADIKLQIDKKETTIREENEQKARKKAEDEFNAVKQKLDKAFALDILTAQEYNDKLEAAQKRLDNYDLLKKVEMQLSMGIISKAEYDEKVKKYWNNYLKYKI